MTLMLVDAGASEETRNDALRRRLRGEMAERQLTASEICKRLGITNPVLSRRITGQTPFDLDFVQDICDVTGISFVYLTTGIREAPKPGPDGPLSPPSGLNRRPSLYKGGGVVDLAERRRRSVAPTPGELPAAA